VGKEYDEKCNLFSLGQVFFYVLTECIVMFNKKECGDAA